MNVAKRCPKLSRAWLCQCELEANHVGLCDSAGDGFHGYDPRTDWIAGACPECERWASVGHRRSCSKFKGAK